MKKTTWGLPARIAGTVLLILSPVIAFFLIRPYWSNLIIATILSFFLRPLAGLFQRRLHLKKTAAILLTMLLLLIVLAVPLLLLPALVESLANLIRSLVDSLETLSVELTAFLVDLEPLEIGGQVIDLSPLTAPLVHFLNTSFLEYASQTPEEAVNIIITVLSSTLSGINGLISFFFTLFFTLTFTLYILLDLSWLAAGLRFALPTALIAEWKSLLPRLVFIWAAYIRGQLGVMLAVGVIVTIAMWLLGVPNALALGFIAAILELIPNLGPILAAVPAVIVALFQGSTWLDINPLLLAMIVGLVYFLIQQLEDVVLTPNIQGKAMEMPPLVVMLSVLVGIHEFGLLGGILAVPIVATVREILRYVKDRIERSQPSPVEQEVGNSK